MPGFAARRRLEPDLTPFNPHGGQMGDGFLWYWRFFSETAMRPIIRAHSEAAMPKGERWTGFERFLRKTDEHHAAQQY